MGNPFPRNVDFYVRRFLSWFATTSLANPMIPGRQRLPFDQTRDILNAFNLNRPVKIARDGTLRLLSLDCGQATSTDNQRDLKVPRWNL